MVFITFSDYQLHDHECHDGNAIGITAESVAASNGDYAMILGYRRYKRECLAV